jgi:hypothetical protein
MLLHTGASDMLELLPRATTPESAASTKRKKKKRRRIVPGSALVGSFFFN